MDPRSAKPQLLLTVHGIRTFGQWQQRLGHLVRAASPDIIVCHYGYGYFSLVAFWIPILRWLAVAAFRRELLRLAERFPKHQLTLVGHSNGTYLIAWALYRNASRLKGRIDQIVLAGSVLKTTFAWGKLIDRIGIRRVINDCGTNDNILLLSQIAVLFTGLGGRLGFSGITGDVLLNRFFVGGHSHYFEVRGKPSDSFMEAFWVPLVAHGATPTEVDERKFQGPIHGATLWLIQNADLMKGVTYALAAYLLFSTLYLAPRRIASQEIQRRTVATALNQFASESLPHIALRDLAREVSRDIHGLETHLMTLGYQLPRSTPGKIWKACSQLKANRILAPT